jgi:small subunit ribosomal protein S2
MKPYLAGKEKNIHIFNLEKTADGMKQVCEHLQAIIERGGTVLLATTKPQCTEALANLARKVEQPVVTERWMPGLLTNWGMMRKRIQSYLDLKHSFQSGDVEKYTKKEQLKLRKHLAKLERAFSGVSMLKHLPDALLVLDNLRDRIAILEARTMQIPVFGICDSNGDPDLFTKFIPANDDSIHSVTLILRTIEDAILEARSKRTEEKASAPQAEHIAASTAKEPETVAA